MLKFTAQPRKDDAFLRGERILQSLSGSTLPSSVGTWSESLHLENEEPDHTKIENSRLV